MADSVTEASGSIAAALANGTRLLAVNPAAAETQAREILNAVPAHPQAQWLLGSALRLQGNARASREVLEPLAKEQPNAAAVHYDLGLVYAATGERKRAIERMARATALKADLIHAWRDLGDEFVSVGDSEGADDAYARHIRASVKDPQLLQAANALCEGRLAVAEQLLRDYLKLHPTDVAAIRMLAEIGTRLGRYADAENLLTRCLELAPGFTPARHNYALVLHRQMKSQEALVELGKLLAQDPKNPSYRNLQAAALARAGDYEGSVQTYEALLKELPGQAKTWMSYGHALKTVGRRDDAQTAYRKSIALVPWLGEAWWSLANLKTIQFSHEDIALMGAQIRRSGLTNDDRFHLHFTLGKALEDEKRYDESFVHYAKGNALRLDAVKHEKDESQSQVQRMKAVFTPDFLTRYAGSGSQASDPIFILGMPRSGSTLTEQILSSHSRVEGTAELPDILALAGKVGNRKRRLADSDYPEALSEIAIEELKALGDEYIARTRIHRRSDPPFFIDKMPNNFLHTGFIHLILPNAKIIDVRRHPLACCFSNFKQHFARGQYFSYDLARMGRYYASYVELMSHFDKLMPGRVHRVIYEELVADPEAEVRRLLGYCGLQFEEGCLRFYENDRPVRTASSEQVRQPIFKAGLDQWQHYENELQPLKDALGDVLTAYPDVPAF